MRINQKYEKKKRYCLLSIHWEEQVCRDCFLIALLNNMDIKKYDIYLYVVLNQGEMVKELPSYVKLLNKHYCKESVLSSKGKKVLIRGIFKNVFTWSCI